MRIQKLFLSTAIISESYHSNIFWDDRRGLRVLLVFHGSLNTNDRQDTCDGERESDTPWSAREAAVRVIVNSFDELVELLQTMNEYVSQSSDTRQKPNTLINNLVNFNFVCYLQFYIF